MNPQDQSYTSGNHGKMIDFVPQKLQTPQSSQTSQNSGSTTDPTPQPVITSAQAAINAMYAERAQQAQPEVAMSAREAVNAAAGQNAIDREKSAANLHHGSIQKNMESTRTSASALLRVAKSKPVSSKDTQPVNSFDPLAKPKPIATKPKRTTLANQAGPSVVRTSLKLGAAAKPKQTPVILPPNARMAQNARPVGMTLQPKNKLTRLLSRKLVNAEIVPKKSLPGASPRTIEPSQGTTVEVDVTGTIAETKPTSVPRPRSTVIRDPQMLQAKRPATARANAATRAARSARVADVVGQQMGQPAKFRSAPRGFAAAAPAPTATDTSYVMAEPPKITARKPKTVVQTEDLGVVKSYHQSREPQPLGDHTPIGRVTEQKVASGHGGAAPEAKVKADNTSNYSFSKQLEPDANRYALGGQSPFLKSVNVEKRPLSGEGSHLGGASKAASNSSIEAPAKPAKAPRKNIYPKKSTAKEPSAKEAKRSAPNRPTVIVPSSHRSKAPLFFLIVITIILGAAVGAAAYLCFFQ